MGPHHASDLASVGISDAMVHDFAAVMQVLVEVDLGSYLNSS